MCSFSPEHPVISHQCYYTYYVRKVFKAILKIDFNNYFFLKDLIISTFLFSIRAVFYLPNISKYQQNTSKNTIFCHIKCLLKNRLNLFCPMLTSCGSLVPTKTESWLTCVIPPVGLDFRHWQDINHLIFLHIYKWPTKQLLYLYLS